MPPCVLIQTQNRFLECQEVRDQHERRTAPPGRSGRPGILTIDDPTLVALHSRRVPAQPVIQQDLAERGLRPLETLGTVEDLVLERILGGDNPLGTALLKRGALVARTVGPLSFTIGWGPASGPARARWYRRAS